MERASVRASLVVQWLRLQSLNAGDLGSIPGEGTRSHMLQLRLVQPNQYFTEFQVYNISWTYMGRAIV